MISVYDNIFYEMLSISISREEPISVRLSFLLKQLEHVGRDSPGRSKCQTSASTGSDVADVRHAVVFTGQPPFSRPA